MCSSEEDPCKMKVLVLYNCIHPWVMLHQVAFEFVGEGRYGRKEQLWEGKSIFISFARNVCARGNACTRVHCCSENKKKVCRTFQAGNHTQTFPCVRQLS